MAGYSGYGAGLGGYGQPPGYVAVAAYTDLAGFAQVDTPILVKGAGLFARDGSAHGDPWVPAFVHPIIGGGKYALVGSIVAGAMSDPQVGAIDLTGFADDKSVRINGTLIAATGADIDLLGADFEANINAEAAVNTLVTAAYDAATNRVRVTSTEAGVTFTLTEEDDTGDEMVVTEHLTRVAAMTDTAASGEWAVVTADGGTVTDQSTYIRLLTDPAEGASLASLALQMTLVADKRLVVVAEWGAVSVGPNTTAAHQAQGASLYFDDTRAGEQIGYAPNVAAEAVARWVNWSNGARPDSSAYTALYATVRPHIISLGPRNAGNALQCSHWVQTADDGVMQATCYAGKTGSAPGGDQLVFLAANNTEIGVTGAQVRVNQVAVYMEV